MSNGGKELKIVSMKHCSRGGGTLKDVLVSTRLQVCAPGGTQAVRPAQALSLGYACHVIVSGLAPVKCVIFCFSFTTTTLVAVTQRQVVLGVRHGSGKL